MTRAIDRLIVAGSVDGERRDPKTPIGWVLDRLELGELEDGEVVRGEARLRFAVDRFAPEPAQAEPEQPPAEAQLSLFDAERVASRRRRVPALPPLEPVAAPPVEPVRRLSYSALALFERCPYRFYAERLGGMRPVDGAAGAIPGQTGMAASEIGDSVHRLLERVDLAAPAPPSLDQVLALVPGRDRRGARSGSAALVEAYCALGARRAAGGARRRVRRSGRSRSSTTACSSTASSTCSTSTAAARSSPTSSRTCSASYSPAEVVEAEYRLQRLVYAIACFRAGAEEVEVVYQFLERPDELGRGDVPARRSCPSSRPSSRRRSRGSRRAGSRRARASSPAPAARRSTWSAPGPALLRLMTSRPAARRPPARSRS